MQREGLIDILRSTDGKIFGVTFIKKDGTIRDLNGRFQVKKGVKGVGLKFNPVEKGLMTVFDVKKDAFRMININTVQSVRFQGQEYKIDED